MDPFDYQGPPFQYSPFHCAAQGRSEQFGLLAEPGEDVSGAWGGGQGSPDVEAAVVQGRCGGVW